MGIEPDLPLDLQEYFYYKIYIKFSLTFVSIKYIILILVFLYIYIARFLLSIKRVKKRIVVVTTSEGVENLTIKLNIF